MALNRLDIILVVLIGLSAIMGIVKGLVRESVTLGSAILGLIVAGAQYTRLADAIEPQMRSREMALLVSFLSIFTAILLIGVFMAVLVSKILKDVGRNWVDRLLGGLLGFVRGAVAALVVVFALVAFPVRVETVTHSRLAIRLLEPAAYAAYLVPPDVQHRFLEGRTRCGGSGTRLEQEGLQPTNTTDQSPKQPRRSQKRRSLAPSVTRPTLATSASNRT